MIYVRIMIATIFRRHLFLRLAVLLQVAQIYIYILITYKYIFCLLNYFPWTIQIYRRQGFVG